MSLFLSGPEQFYGNDKFAFQAFVAILQFCSTEEYIIPVYEDCQIEQATRTFHTLGLNNNLISHNNKKLNAILGVGGNLGRKFITKHLIAASLMNS